jgi:hypothetical protein
MDDEEKNLRDNILKQTEFNIRALKKEIKGVDALNAFVKQELAFWNGFKHEAFKYINILSTTNQNLNKASSKIKMVLEKLQGESVDNASMSHIEQLIIEIKNNIDNVLLYSEQKESYFVKKLIDLECTTEEIRGACSFLIKTKNNEFDFKPGQQTINPEFLKGFIRAYEFNVQDNSTLATRAQFELKSLEKIKTEWNTLIADANKEYESEIEALKTKFKAVTEQYLQIEEKQKTLFTSIEQKVKNWENNLEYKFNQFEREKSGVLDSVLLEKTKKFTALENTYNDKLQLEAPVTYWDKRAKKYQKNGKIWFVVFMVTIAAALAYFGWFINQINATNFVLNGKFNPDAIKNILTFLTVVSFGAYLIKVFSKLTFSNFHLQRDSEERHQLTMVYLALIKDGTHQVHVEDKKIILQALFGRVDTGLLGGDSAPTIPGINTVIEKVTGK